MRVRPIEAHDADAWLDMRARLWPDADRLGLSREVQSFLAGGDDKGMLDAAFVAEDESGRIVGFLELSVRAFSDGCDSAPVPHVEGWFVHGTHRGEGIGRSLVRAAEEWSRGRGFTELASDAELANIHAQQAHRHLGFEEVDRLVKFRKRLT